MTCPKCGLPMRLGRVHRCGQTLGQQLERQRAWRREYDRKRTERAKRRRASETTAR